jgi:hypothetical protein
MIYIYIYIVNWVLDCVILKVDKCTETLNCVKSLHVRADQTPNIVQIKQSRRLLYLGFVGLILDTSGFFFTAVVVSGL